ncbi:MAG: beta-lactamase [Frondihabitans sp.]|nr:beta-lactamase [Frondihabitans sp.]
MVGLPTAAPREAGVSPEGLALVDRALQAYVDAGVLAGVSTLVARHGRVVHTSILGVDDLATGKPLTPDTLFRIFSMTKPVTAVAMTILHDRGLWQLDDPIAKHLPEFEGVRVFAGFDDHGVPLLVAPTHAPTLRELLTHTAGFSYGSDPENPVDAFYAKADVMSSPDLPEFSRRMASVPLNYQPGTKWLYSLSVDLQGALIERLSGQPLGEFFAENIFGPLGMTETAFFTDPAKVDRRATLYYTGPDPASGRPLTLQPVANPLLPDFESEPAMPAGGAGLVSTIGDYARFAHAILGRGELDGVRIVSAEGIDLMTSNHVSDDIISGGFGVGSQSLRPGTGYGFNGLVFTDPEAAGLPVGRGTYQWDGAAGTWFWVDPENDVVFVGLIQLLSPTGPALQEETQKLVGAALV